MGALGGQSRVGCSVYVLNAGIDTEDIVAVKEVDTMPARSVDALREIVDEAQVALLGQVLRFADETGSLPPAHPQGVEEGRQYFGMHPDLKASLQAKLAVERDDDFAGESDRAFKELPSLRNVKVSTASHDDRQSGPH